MKSRYLILGASGLIGQRLFEHIGGELAIGTYCRTPIVNGLQFNVLTDNFAELLQTQEGLEFAIIMFAETKIDRCATEPDVARALNVTVTKKMIDTLGAADITPVFISTDMVFDGARGNYTEEDPAIPSVTYGRMKKEIEDYLVELGRPYLSVRLSRVLSGLPEKATDLSLWIKSVNEGVNIYCAHDQFSSGIDLEDVVIGLKALMDIEASGIFHLGGPEAVSRADMFNLLMDEFSGYPNIKPSMQTCSIRDFSTFIEARPFDTSLNSEKFISASGHVPRHLNETCRAFAEAFYSK
jgi:dTDP-4-dehydrorhamnose reductase